MATKLIARYNPNVKTNAGHIVLHSNNMVGWFSDPQSDDERLWQLPGPWPS